MQDLRLLWINLLLIKFGFSVAAAMTIGALVAAIKNQFSVAAVMVVATFIGANLETTITSLGITTLLM
jgi:hypothetical protein